MTLPLTPEMLAASYDFLLTTPPFDKWNLPPSEDVKFKVNKSRKVFARYQMVEDRHTITVSINAVGFIATLMEKMSHEIIHLHLEEMGMDSRGTADTHSGAFRKLAAQVCKQHGFDPKAFY